MRILHIEDDDHLRKFVRQGLEREGFAVDSTAKAQEGVRLAAENHYDAILIDVVLPGFDGYWALKTLRGSGHQAMIMMITGQKDEAARLRAFQDGADDYMVKPIFLSELAARIRVWLKRHSALSGDSGAPLVLSAGPVSMDLMKRRVTVRGKDVGLTPKEFSALEYLLRHAGRVVTQESLAQAVWSLDYDTGTNVVEVLINRLRNKIDLDGKPSLIQTIRGCGYMME